MPKSKEYVSSDDSSDEEVAKKSKKQKRERDSSGTMEGNKEEKTSKKPKKEGGNEDGENVWDLGNNRQVSVRDFKGRLFVDIREMYFDKDGNLKPGKKGICLNMSQWRKLLAVIEEVDQVVKSKA